MHDIPGSGNFMVDAEDRDNYVSRDDGDVFDFREAIAEEDSDDERDNERSAWANRCLLGEGGITREGE